MKKLISFVLAICVCFALCACGGSSQSSAPVPAAKAESTPVPTPEPTPEPAALLPLEIKEFGWSLSGDYLYYAFIFHNPNESTCIEYPKFRITARDDAGILLGSEEQTLCISYPGQDAAYGFMAFKVDAVPADVQIEYLDPSEYNVKDVSMVKVPDYKPLQVVNHALRDKKIVGEVQSENDVEFFSVAVSVLFRDNDGALLGGTTTFVDKVNKGLTPFELSIYEKFATENYEIWAQPWM